MKVIIQDDDGTMLAGVNIERNGGLPDAVYSSYSIQAVVVHPNGDEASHQWVLHDFERLDYNVLGLVWEALNQASIHNLRTEDRTIPGTVRHGGVSPGGPGMTILRAIGPVRE